MIIAVPSALVLLLLLSLSLLIISSAAIVHCVAVMPYLLFDPIACCDS